MNQNPTASSLKSALIQAIKSPKTGQRKEESTDLPSGVPEINEITQRKEKPEIPPSSAVEISKPSAEDLQKSLTDKAYEEVIDRKINELLASQKSQLDAAAKLDLALEKSSRLNPETLGFYRSENNRLLNEIASLQREVDKLRKANQEIVGKGVAGYWKDAGEKFGDWAEKAFDLIDGVTTKKINEGDLSPETLKYIVAKTRELAEMLSSYSETCLAYGEENK